VISRSHIAQTALEIIDESGLESLSVARIASKLDCQPPSLYYHFAGKGEILQEVSRLLLSEIPPIDLSRFGADSWQDIIVDKTWASYVVLTRHPNAVPLIFEYYPHQLTAEPYDEGARLFAAAGIPYEYHLLLTDGLEWFTYGAAAAAARGDMRFAPFNVAQFPTFDKSLRANAFDEEQLFKMTCRAFLLGIERIIAG
jgi:AcrR family transcriptional regulator